MKTEENRDSRWRVHLQWMLENRPSATLAMHKSDSLGPYLDRKHQEALRLVDNLKDEGMTEDEAFEAASQSILAPTPEGDQEPGKPLSSDQEKEILRSLSAPIPS